MILSNKLRELRHWRKLSQIDLSVQADVSPLTIHVIEKGRLPRQETRAKLAQALGVQQIDVWPKLDEAIG